MKPLLNSYCTNLLLQAGGTLEHAGGRLQVVAALEAERVEEAVEVVGAQVGEAGARVHEAEHVLVQGAVVAGEQVARLALGAQLAHEVAQAQQLPLGVQVGREGRVRLLVVLQAHVAFEEDAVERGLKWTDSKHLVYK